MFRDFSYTHPYPVICYFKGIGFQKISFTGKISSVLKRELVMMERAHGITQRVDITFGKICSRMGTVGLKGEKAVVVTTDADRFFACLYLDDAIGGEYPVQLRIRNPDSLICRHDWFDLQTPPTRGLG